MQIAGVFYSMSDEATKHQPSKSTSSSFHPRTRPSTVHETDSLRLDSPSAPWHHVNLVNGCVVLTRNGATTPKPHFSKKRQMGPVPINAREPHNRIHTRCANRSSANNSSLVYTRLRLIQRLFRPAAICVCSDQKEATAREPEEENNGETILLPKTTHGKQEAATAQLRGKHGRPMESVVLRQGIKKNTYRPINLQVLTASRAAASQR